MAFPCDYRAVSAGVLHRAAAAILHCSAAGGYVGDLWSDGNIPGAGLIYAAGDGNATTILDDPNPTGANPALPVGVPVALVTSAIPEPGSVFLLGIGLLGMLAVWARKASKALNVSSH